MKNDKPWGGRFAEGTEASVEAFTASVDFDRRLYRYDIMGSIAHARMLAHVGVLSERECESIVRGLQDIEGEIERGEFAFSVALEDVHMNIEARLIDRIGEAGKKLHTGRSRNDQIATDLRLFLREGVDQLDQSIAALQGALLTLAERELETVMPGFTHLQVAQPITLGHHLMAWFEMLQRDRGRLADCRGRINVLPLGAAALAGTGYPLDRAYTARLLGFDAVAENSMDAVSDRDFAVEFTAACALLMVHLSRMSEELILWSSTLTGFIELADAYCTGSSIMPQKKNPDVPELIRGKTGRVCGDLMALLMLMKAQPLAYNKDNQEDKEPVFNALDTALASTRVLTGLLGALRVDRKALAQAARRGYATATDLADYLVRKGVAFREAHEIVGRAVRKAIAEGKDLAELSIDALRDFSPLIEPDVYQVLSMEGSIRTRNITGGTAPNQIKEAIVRARKRMQNAD